MTRALLLLWLLPSAVSAQSTASSEAAQHVQAGTAAEQAHQYETAIAEFRKATDLRPSDAVGFVRLGRACMEQHTYEQAVVALQRALQEDPELEIAHRLLGYAYLAQGYAVDAIPHLERVHELRALGIAQIQTGQVAEAVVNLQAEVKKSPNDPDLLYYLSKASEMLAQQSRTALLGSFPESERTHQVQGQDFFALHKLSEAEMEYQQALALRPDLPGLHLELGQVYAEGAQWLKADEQYRAEVSLQPGSGEAAYRLGDALLHEGKAQEALRELQQSDRLRPDMSETLYSLGKAAFAAGDGNAAERAWTRVIAIERESPLAAQAHFSLAGLYRKQGDADKATSEMQQFHKLQERSRKTGPH
jgi:tetratricopeptide (TPR) repeat protein